MMIDYSRLMELIQSYPLVALVTGLVIWVFGWRIYKAFIIIAGAVITATLANQYIAFGDQVTRLLITIAGGFVGAMLAVFALYLGIFLYGFYIGAGIASAYLGSNAIVLAYGFGALLGLLLVFLLKITVVAMTSFTGAFLAVKATLFIFQPNVPEIAAQAAILALTVIGFFVQYRLWGAPDVPDGMEPYRRNS